MFNPFDSAFVSTNDRDVAQAASVKSPTTVGNAKAARFPSTVVGHEQSKYERIVGGGGVLPASDDGVTVGLYIPKPFFGPHNDDHSIVAAHGWKATFDSAKGKLYFSKLSDKSQRCWTLPAYETAAPAKSAVKGTTKKTTAKKPASSKKKPSTKKSTKQSLTSSSAPSDAATSEASEQRGDDDDDEEEDDGGDDHDNPSSSYTKPYGGDSYLRSANDNPYDDDGDDDVFSRFSNAARIQPTDPSLYAGGGNVYDEDPFSMYHPHEQQEQQPLQHASKYSVAQHHVVAEKPPVPGVSAMMSRDPSSSDSNGDEENATGIFRDDAHRSLSGRHLENASSQDIPDDAVPPLSSPMPHNLQHGGGMNTSTTTLPQSHVTLSSSQQQLPPNNINNNSNSRRMSDDYCPPYAHNRDDGIDDSTDAGYERSVPPSSSSNAAAQMEVNPQLAWLIHELDMLPDDEESAREDILLIESSDRDILAYEAAAEFEDVCFNIATTATRGPKPEASPIPSSSLAAVTTSEVVGALAAMIVDEADKFRRKEDAVQSELAVLIQKKSLDDRFLQSNSSSDAASPPAKRTALEELLLATSSPAGSTEASPPQEAPYTVDAANYSNSPGHQRDQVPPTVCPRHEEDEENGFAPFPSFSQTSSATFAPAQGDDDGEAEHQQEVGSPVLRDEDFPTSSLAKHIRSDSIYIAHHSDDRRDYVKEGIEHPEEHHVVPSIVGRRSSASVELVGESPSSASVARRRRVSLDVNVASPSGDTLDDRASDDAGQLHATFVSSADLRGLSKYQPGYTDDSNDDGPASSPMLRDDDFPTSTLAKHLRKDSIYVARHHREHQDFVKEGMENPEEHHHIASLSSSGAALSMSGGASASSSRHRRTSVNDGLDFDIDDGSVSNNNASGLRPSFVSSADLKGLSSYNNATTNNDHRHHLEYNDGAASPMLRDEDFPTSALARHVRNDSIYFAHHKDEHIEFVRDGIEHPEEHHHVSSLPGRRSTNNGDGISPQSAERRRRNSQDVLHLSGDALADFGSSEGSLHPSFVAPEDEHDDEDENSSTTGGAAEGALARNIRNDSIYFAHNKQQHLDFVKDGINNPDEYNYIATLSGSNRSDGGGRGGGRGNRTGGNDGSVSFPDDASAENNGDLRPTFVSSADLRGISSISAITTSSAASPRTPTATDAVVPSPTAASAGAIASPFAAAAAASGGRRNRQLATALPGGGAGVVFVDQQRPTGAESSLLLTTSSIVSSSIQTSAAKLPSGSPRQRVVMVEEPLALESPRSNNQNNSNTANVQKQFVSAVTAAAGTSSELNTSTDSNSSPSFGPRVESFSEGSPSSALVNSASSFTLGSGDGLANRRLRRARDSMIIARDPNAHRSYVLEKSAEKLVESVEEEDEHDHAQNRASFMSGLPPPSGVNTRRGSLETLGSSTSTIDLPSPSSHGGRHHDEGEDDIHYQQQQQQQQPIITSPMLGSSSTSNNNFGFTHDSIALAHDPAGHKDYVRQHAETFSALSRMEWDAVEQQRQRLFDDDAQRAKLNQLSAQHQLQQQYSQFLGGGGTPFSGSSDSNEATSALARLRQLQMSIPSHSSSTMKEPQTSSSSSAVPAAQSNLPSVVANATVPLIERESALKWIQQEARARIMQQHTSVERTWAVDSLAREVMPSAANGGYHSAAASALATGTALAAASSLGNDPNLLLEQRLAQVMGRLLTQDSVYLYQQALDAMLIDNAAWSLEAMNLYREFVATMPPKTREVEVQAPEGGLLQKDSGTDARQPPGFTPSFPLGDASNVVVFSSSRVATTTSTTTTTQQQQQQQQLSQGSGSSHADNLHPSMSEDEENELLARLQRIRALRGDTTSISTVSSAAAPYHNGTTQQRHTTTTQHQPAPTSIVTRYPPHEVDDVGPSFSVAEVRRHRFPRLIHTPEVPVELRRSDSGAALARLSGAVYAQPAAEVAFAHPPPLSPVHPHQRSTLPLGYSPVPTGQQQQQAFAASNSTPAGFYRAQQHPQGGYSPASSVISTPPPPREDAAAGASAMFPVFSKPSPRNGVQHHHAAASSTPNATAAAVLRWDVKRSGNVLISQSGTLTMSDSSRALKALHEDGTLAAQDKSTVSIPMFALGTVGISQGDLVFEARFELRASKEALPAAATSSSARQASTSASGYRAGQRASLHKTYIGVASKYYRGASRSTPAYLYCSDGTISATSALSNPQSTAEAIPYGRPFHSSAVVTIHLSFSRRELSFAVDGVPQGVAFKFQRQDDPEPLFPLVVFTGDGDSCAFQAPSLPPQSSSVFGPPSAMRTRSRSPPQRNQLAGAAGGTAYSANRNGGGHSYRADASPLAPQNVSRPLY